MQFTDEQWDIYRSIFGLPDSAKEAIEAQVEEEIELLAAPYNGNRRRGIAELMILKAKMMKQSCGGRLGVWIERMIDTAPNPAECRAAWTYHTSTN